MEALEDSIDKVRAEIDTHMEQVRHLRLGKPQYAGTQAVATRHRDLLWT